MKITTVNGRTEISEKGKIFLVAHRVGTLYFIATEGGDTTDSLRQMYAEETRKASLVSTSTWHNRLGHLHETALDKIPPISDRETTKLREPCDICIQAKMKRLPFQRSHGKKPDHLLERIHSDVVGPINPRSLGGGYYFVVSLDEYSNYVSAVPVKQKSDVFEEFVKFQNHAELARRTKIKEIQTDNGGENVNRQFQNHLNRCGILHRRSVPYSPQQCGKIERQNHTILAVIICFLIQSGLPHEFWAEALNTACSVRNLCPSKAIDDKIPFELWNSRKIEMRDIEHHRVFGCQAWTHLSEGKINRRAEECILLGYPEGVKGYRLWFIASKKVVVSRYIIFF